MGARAQIGFRNPQFNESLPIALRARHRTRQALYPLACMLASLTVHRRNGRAIVDVRDVELLRFSYARGIVISYNQ